MIRREIDRLEALYDAQGVADKVLYAPLAFRSIWWRSGSAQARVKSVVALMGADQFYHLRMVICDATLRTPWPKAACRRTRANSTCSCIFMPPEDLPRSAKPACRAEVEGALGILCAGANATLLEIF